MPMSKLKSSTRLLTLFYLTLLMVGCAKNNTDNTPKIDIPPISTFKIDFSQFPSASLTAQSLDGGLNARAFTKGNYTNAAAQVVVWQTLITVGLAIPVAACGIL